MLFCRLVLLVLGLVFCRSSWAQNAGVQSVRVVVAGDQATTEALHDQLARLLAERQVHLEWSRTEAILTDEVLAPSTEETLLLARIWLDLKSEQRALLYVKAPKHDRYLVRALPLENGYDELCRESLANIVESAVDVLLQGGEFGVSRQEAVSDVKRQQQLGVVPPPSTPKPQDKPPMPPPAAAQGPKGPKISLFLAARLDTLDGTDAARMGPELGLFISGTQRPGWSWLAWIQGGYHFSTRVEHELAEVQLWGPGARLLFGARARTRHFVWRLAGGGGLDLSRVSTQTNDSSLEANPDFWLVTPLLCAMTAVELHVARSWLLSLAAGAELDLGGDHFDISQGGTTTTVFQPWRVRPVVQLALGFTFPEK